jgi:hypothetical protein
MPALACMLLLSLLAGAGQAGGSALAGLLARLGCACTDCPLAGQRERGPERSCCGGGAEEGGFERAAESHRTCCDEPGDPDTGEPRTCPCFHPVELPLHHDELALASAATGILERLLRAADVSAHAPLPRSACAGECALRGEADAAARGGARSAVLGFAGARRLERGAPGLLAALGTALI